MSFEQDLKTDLQAAAAAPALPDGDLERVMRRGARRRLVARAGTVLGSAAVVVFALGSVVWLAGGGDEDPVALTTTTAGVTTSTPATTTTPPPVSSTTTSQAPTTTTTLPAIPPGIPQRDYQGMPDNVGEGYAVHAFEGVFLSSRTVGRFSWRVVDAPSTFTASDTIRDDLRGGIVYLDSDIVGDDATGATTLMWYPAGAEFPVTVAELGTEFFGDVLDVIERDGTFYAVVGAIQATADEAALYELGGPGTGAISLRDLRRSYVSDGENQLPIYRVASTDGTRVAFVEQDPCPPSRCDEGFENPNPAYLVVLDGSGSTLFRQEIPRRDTDIAFVEDFDGNRLILVREPYEPAIGIKTVFVIDFRCGPGCTERFHVTGAPATLLGSGPVEPAQFGIAYPLDECSAAGMSATVADQAGLPADVALTRTAIAQAAASCDWSALTQLSFLDDDNLAPDLMSSRFELIVSHRGIPFGTFDGEWKQTDALLGPVVAEVRSVLDLPFGRVDGGYQWPIWANIPKEELQGAALEALRTYVEEELGEDFDTYLERSFEIGDVWGGTHLLIDDAGTWTAVVRPLS